MIFAAIQLGNIWQVWHHNNMTTWHHDAVTKLLDNSYHIKVSKNDLSSLLHRNPVRVLLCDAQGTPLHPTTFFYPPPFTCNKTRLECPKGLKDEVKQARRAKRVAEGHQLEIGAQRAPRFLVCYIF